MHEIWKSVANAARFLETKGSISSGLSPDCSLLREILWFVSSSVIGRIIWMQQTVRYIFVFARQLRMCHVCIQNMRNEYATKPLSLEATFHENVENASNAWFWRLVAKPAWFLQNKSIIITWIAFTKIIQHTRRLWIADLHAPPAMQCIDQAFRNISQNTGSNNTFCSPYGRTWPAPPLPVALNAVFKLLFVTVHTNSTLLASIVQLTILSGWL